MTETNRWRKSTYSSSNGGNCTEVAASPGTVLIRDNKDPDGTCLAFGTGSWQIFVDRVKTGV
jgi:hypothetical protein